MYVRGDAVDEPDLAQHHERRVGARALGTISRRELGDDAIEVADALEREGRAPSNLGVRVAQRGLERRRVGDMHRLEGLERANPRGVVGVGEGGDEHVDAALALDARHRARRVGTDLRRRIAQGRAHDRLKGARIADGAQRFGCGHAKAIVAVVQPRHEVVDGPRIADAPEDARSPHPRRALRRVGEQPQQRGSGHRAEGGEGLGDGARRLLVGLGQRFDEQRDGRLVAQLREGRGGGALDRRPVLVAIAQGADQRRHRRRQSREPEDRRRVLPLAPARRLPEPPAILIHEFQLAEETRAPLLLGRVR